ncbi:MAG: hypothetical protein ABSD13_19810 [Candidatus Korobacteraceae bacterium]
MLVAWISMTISATLRYDAEARGFKQILSDMEPNQRALSLMFIQTSQGFPAPVFLHFPAWYSATKQGVVDVNFAVFAVELVRYRPGEVPTDPMVSEIRPQKNSILAGPRKNNSVRCGLLWQAVCASQLPTNR